MMPTLFRMPAMLARRAVTTASLTVASVLLASGAAFAFWTVAVAPSSQGSATTRSLSAPSGASASAVSSNKITVSWTLPGAQLTGANYKVTRTSGPGSPTTVCTVTSNVDTCDDTSLSAGTSYGYSVVAVLATNWASTASTASGTTLAADGSGTMTVSPTSAIASSTGNTLTFTYTAAAGGMSNGAVSLTVPSGWSAPSTTGANNGFSTSTAGTLGTSGQVITVSGLTLTGGSTFDIVYGSKASGGAGATAPASAGSQTWQAQQRSTSGGTLTNLATSPSVTVAGNTLVITTAPVSGATSATANLGAITVQRRTGGGTPITTGSLTVNLSSSGGGTGVFSLTQFGPNVTSVTIPNGSSSATFFYGNNTVGTPTITAAGSGFTSGTQQETITTAPAGLGIVITGGTGSPSAVCDAISTSYTCTVSGTGNSGHVVFQVAFLDAGATQVIYSATQSSTINESGQNSGSVAIAANATNSGASTLTASHTGNSSKTSTLTFGPYTLTINVT